MIRIPALIAEKILMTIVLMMRQELVFLPLQILRLPEMMKKTELHIPVPKTPIVPKEENSKSAMLEKQAAIPQRICISPMIVAALDL